MTTTYDSDTTLEEESGTHIGLQRWSFATDTQEDGSVTIEEGVVDKVALAPRVLVLRIEVIHTLLAEPAVWSLLTHIPYEMGRRCVWLW